MNPLISMPDFIPVSPVIVALDFNHPDQAMDFVSKLSPQMCQLKIGKELFTATGYHFVETLINRGFKIFLDLKYHDIPNTVAQACKIAAQMGVWMVDIHTMGGSRMMHAAAEAIASFSNRPLLIGVTILTSIETTDLQEIGITVPPDEMVLRLAILAQKSGLDGVVCSAQEAAFLRTHLTQDFALVTPGIRPAGHNQKDDQRRIMTPEMALAAGSSYLVIGRPITQAANPVAVIQQINTIKKQQ